MVVDGQYWGPHTARVTLANGGAATASPVRVFAGPNPEQAFLAGVAHLVLREYAGINSSLVVGPAHVTAAPLARLGGCSEAANLSACCPAALTSNPACLTTPDPARVPDFTMAPFVDLFLAKIWGDQRLRWADSAFPRADSTSAHAFHSGCERAPPPAPPRALPRLIASRGDPAVCPPRPRCCRALTARLADPASGIRVPLPEWPALRPSLGTTWHPTPPSCLLSGRGLNC